MPKIESVEPMAGYRLKIALDNGNVLILDLSRKLNTTRFRQLKQQAGLFGRALADGERVYWDELTELSVGELMEPALSEGADGCRRRAPPETMNEREEDRP
ncbi:MAG: DUF2442 domain-containing protein [Clostridiales bacterium]|nr:DUF2442 domain-containing protein [Clostridiales bacterium]OPZ67676.1 MAG: hypothetical protein BWY81_01194 [Firmicutes bacterium ADurb.Bin467]